jgi:uncharacterized protein
MKPLAKSKKSTPPSTKRVAPLLYQIRRSAIQGRGAFATTSIAKGVRIVEYAGERISNRIAGERYDDLSMKRHHTFLFTLTSRTCIDGNSEGNDARYINHSCAPNCEAIQVGKQIFIFAKKPIHAGDELTYDYAYEVEDPEPGLYKCICGAPKCRGTMVKNQPRKKARKS